MRLLAILISALVPIPLLAQTTNPSTAFPTSAPAIPSSPTEIVLSDGEKITAPHVLSANNGISGPTLCLIWDGVRGTYPTSGYDLWAKEFQHRTLEYGIDGLKWLADQPESVTHASPTTKTTTRSYFIDAKYLTANQPKSKYTVADALRVREMQADQLRTAAEAQAAYARVAVNAANSPEVAVRFSPHGGCTDAIVQQMGQATQQICVQAYEFSSKPIFDALMNARSRGVQVWIIFDKQMGRDEITFAGALRQAGCQVNVDISSGLAHNKVAVIDDSIVLTGSFNYTVAAEERNAENLVIIRSREVGAAFFGNFQNEWTTATIPFDPAQLSNGMLSR